MPLLEIKDFNASINNNSFFYPTARTNKKRMKTYQNVKK